MTTTHTPAKFRNGGTYDPRWLLQQRGSTLPERRGVGVGVGLRER